MQFETVLKDFFACRKRNKELNRDTCCPVQWTMRNMIRQKERQQEDMIAVLFFHTLLSKGGFSKKEYQWRIKIQSRGTLKRIPTS